MAIKRPMETVEDFRRAVRETVIQHPDIPTGIALTGRQLYVQFCYRMSKFDAEFRTLDPVVASSWLNIGLVRLVAELQKRLYKDETDLMAQLAFTQYIMERGLVMVRSVSSPIHFAEYSLGTTNPALTWEWTTEPLQISLVLGAETDFPVNPSGQSLFPKYIPHTRKMIGATLYDVGDPIPVGYREWSDKDWARRHARLSSPLCDLMTYPPIPYVHRHIEGSVAVILGSDWLDSHRDAYPHFEPRVSSWRVDSITHAHIEVQRLLEDARIDCHSKTEISGIPPRLHTDICDYAVDAYFEANFFQSFGKYSTKQARQDSDVQTNPTRQHKLDAVPPQRFRLGSGVQAHA